MFPTCAIDIGRTREHPSSAEMRDLSLCRPTRIALRSIRAGYACYAPIWSGGRGWRHERLALFHDVGDRDPRFLVAGLAACVGGFWRNLETIARFQHPSRLALYGKLKATFQDIAQFDSRMRMPRDRHPRIYFH